MGTFALVWADPEEHLNWSSNKERIIASHHNHLLLGDNWTTTSINRAAKNMATPAQILTQQLRYV